MVFNRPRVRCATVAAGLLVVFLIFSGAVYAADWRQADGRIGILAPRPMEFEEWFRWDVSHLKELVTGHTVNPADTKKILAAETKEIDAEIRRIQEEEAYVHPVRKFRVYPPQSTGKLHVLFLALQGRDRLLASGSPADLPRPEDLYRLGDFRLYPTTTAKYPSVAQAIEALAGIRLPERFFDGYRVYLLPYSLGEIGGEGGNGYSFISAEPAEADLIDDHVFVTLTHEFGHHLQLRYLGGSYGDNPALWDEYMAIRRIPGWRNDGDVQTKDWALSPEETFAEDVRVLFGSKRAVADFYDAAYADPRTDQSMRQAVERFILSLGESGPGWPAEDPWTYPRRSGEYERLKSELRHVLEIGTEDRWWLIAAVAVTILAAVGLNMAGSRFTRPGGGNGVNA